MTWCREASEREYLEAKFRLASSFADIDEDVLNLKSIQGTSCIRTHCLRTLAPTFGGIHKIQVASALRTLGYPSFRDQVLIFCWVEVDS